MVPRIIAMTETSRTMLSVHAHPDDEALFTGGVIARYAREGVRQVLVTCTEGNLGFDPRGNWFGLEEHDPEATAALRRSELEAASVILGIDRLEILGYRDSGMEGWSSAEDPASFVNQPIDDVAHRIAAVILEERPQVVVTYADDGFYGHPDHVFTHKVTMRALEMTGHPVKLYFVAMARGRRQGFADMAAAASRMLPEWIEGDLIVGTDDELVQTFVDCTEVAEIKHRALEAHRSQVDNADLVSLDIELFSSIFGTETFVRAADYTRAALPEDDLFAGVAGIDS